MQSEKSNLGTIIKSARESKGLTQEALAEKLNVGARHIMSIENEGKNPSFKTLVGLVRELHIDANTIFYPENKPSELVVNEVFHIYNNCDENSRNIIKATARAVIENQK